MDDRPPFDHEGHNARRWWPPIDGMAELAKRRIRPRQSRDDTAALAFWNGYRREHGMPRPTYTKLDRQR